MVKTDPSMYRKGDEMDGSSPFYVDPPEGLFYHAHGALDEVHERLGARPGELELFDHYLIGQTDDGLYYVVDDLDEVAQELGIDRELKFRRGAEQRGFSEDQIEAALDMIYDFFVEWKG